MNACSPLENVEHEFTYVLILIKKITKHLLFQDEDVYTFFEPELPSDGAGIARTKVTDGLKLPVERRSSLKLPPSRSGSKSSQARTPRPSPNPDKKTTNHNCGSSRRPSPEKISWNVLDLKGENYFSCSVGRTRTNARYILQSSDDVVSFLKELAVAGSSGSSSS
jgi:trehalose 6-phosphate synthase/phosphatase